MYITRYTHTVYTVTLYRRLSIESDPLTSNPLIILFPSVQHSTDLVLFLVRFVHDGIFRFRPSPVHIFAVILPLDPFPVPRAVMPLAIESFCPPRPL